MDIAAIERVFDAGIACEDCPHYREWVEREPYGETYAARRLARCLVIDGDVNDECPAEE